MAYSQNTTPRAKPQWFCRVVIGITGRFPLKGFRTVHYKRVATLGNKVGGG